MTSSQIYKQCVAGQAAVPHAKSFRRILSAPSFLLLLLFLVNSESSQNKSVLLLLLFHFKRVILAGYVCVILGEYQMHTLSQFLVRLGGDLIV